MDQIPTSTPGDSKESDAVLRLLLVDDEPHVRVGWAMRFGLESDLLIVGEAENGREAIDMARHLNPDIVLMDVNMPVVDGLSATRELLESLPHCAVIIVTIDDNHRVRSKALEAGAAAVVAKHEPFETLLLAVRQHAWRD